LLPRFSKDWNQKDGNDRVWRGANMSRDIYLVAGQPELFTTRPDLTPKLLAAYIDAPARITAQLSLPTTASDITPTKVRIRDAEGNGYVVQMVQALGQQKTRSFAFHFSQ